jgi:hypothetical protein
MPDGTSCGSGGAVCCGGTCDHVQSDKFNCGACGNVCYGGAVTASCFTGHCAQLVAQADNSGGAGYPHVYAPSLAVDANDVYFIAPSDGTLLQSPLSTLGNTAPKVLVTQNSTGTLYGIGALVIDAKNVYYSSFGAGIYASVPIGGGAITQFAVGAGLGGTSTSLYIAVDGTNVYGTFGSLIGEVPKTGGTFTALPGSGSWYPDLVADGTYVYWPSCVAGNNCSITRYTVATGTLAYLATGEANPQGLAVGPTAVYWSAAVGPWNIRTAPIDGSAPASTFQANLAGAGSALAVDPGTGVVYWVEGGQAYGDTSATGPLVKAASAGQPPTTIMSTPVWGTPCFGPNDVYYMMFNTSGTATVQVWRSPK